MDEQQMQAQAQEAAGVTDGWIEPEEGEQEAYDRVVLAAGQIIFAPETNPQVVKMLQNGADRPEFTLANMAVTIFVELDEQSGNTIPEGIFLKPVGEIIEQLGGVAHLKGAFQVDDAMLNRAAQAALSDLGKQYDIPMEELRAFIDEIDLSARDAMVAAQSQYAGVQQAGSEPPGGDGPDGAASAPPPQTPASAEVGGPPAGLISGKMGA